MARFAQIACAATVILTSAAVPARADPINIVSGSVFIPSAAFGDVNIVGTRGFSLTGRVAPGAASSGGVTGPFDQCFFPECTPGTRIDFDLPLSGSSNLGVTMTIEGDRYDDLESVNPMGSVLLHFVGSVIAPEVGPPQVTLSAPFSLTGRAVGFPPLAHDDSLSGRGIGTVTLVPFPTEAGFAPSWMVDSVRFDFLQPTPEPSTLLLLGTCALAVMRARRWRVSES